MEITPEVRMMDNKARLKEIDAVNKKARAAKTGQIQRVWQLLDASAALIY